MSPSYSPDVLDLVRSRNDIVEVISNYFPLKRSGRNYKTLCPFHSEKTPSFMVNQEKQIFHCFGCNVGGDVFSFIMKQERLAFPEAVRFLARRANVVLPEQDSRAVSARAKLLKLHELALEYFRWGLLKSESGGKVRAYLKQRGFGEAAVNKFRLGYAPKSWDGVLRRATNKGYKEKEIVQAGLAIARKEGGGYYDRFRDRLIIPVCDTQGRVIAFGGRVLAETQKEAKYINSPDTPLFRKGSMLFGLHLAKEPISRLGEAVLGEGYFDVIRAHQEGIENVVCSQGTAFTEIQAQVLKRYADRVILAFDADQAGAAAALRGLAIFLHKNIEVGIAIMPPGEDPDSFIRKKGAPAFQNLLKTSIPLLDFKLGELEKKHDIRTDRGKLAVSREMLETISQIESAVLRESYVKKLAGRLGVSEAAVLEDYRKSRRKIRGVALPPVADEKVNKYEVRLLKIILEDDTFIDLIGDELDPADFSLPLRPIVRTMLDLSREGKVPLFQNLTTTLTEEETKARISRWLIEPLDPPGSPQEVAETLGDLKIRGIKEKFEVLKKEIKLGVQAGNSVAHLQAENSKLKTKIVDGGIQLKARLKKKLGINGYGQR